MKSKELNTVIQPAEVLNHLFQGKNLLKQKSRKEDLKCVKISQETTKNPIFPQTSVFPSSVGCFQLHHHLYLCVTSKLHKTVTGSVINFFQEMYTAVTKIFKYVLNFTFFFNFFRLKVFEIHKYFSCLTLIYSIS